MLYIYIYRSDAGSSTMSSPPLRRAAHSGDTSPFCRWGSFPGEACTCFLFEILHLIILRSSRILSLFSLWNSVLVVLLSNWIMYLFSLWSSVPYNSSFEWNSVLIFPLEWNSSLNNSTFESGSVLNSSFQLNFCIYIFFFGVNFYTIFLRV